MKEHLLFMIYEVTDDGAVPWYPLTFLRTEKSLQERKKNHIRAGLTIAIVSKVLKTQTSKFLSASTLLGSLFFTPTEKTNAQNCLFCAMR
jgi:hypothetical protein